MGRVTSCAQTANPSNPQAVAAAGTAGSGSGLRACLLRQCQATTGTEARGEVMLLRTIALTGVG